MALSEEQKQQEWEKKVSEVRKAEEERLISENRKLKQEYRKISREQADYDRQEATKDFDDKLLWDKVRADAEELIETGPRGYNDWATGTSGLISHCLKLAKAMYYDPIFPFRDVIVGYLNEAGDVIWDNTFGLAGEQIGLKLLSKEDLPKFSIHTRIDEKGSVDISFMREGKDLLKEPDPDGKIDALVHHLRTGVTAWALTHDYELKADADVPGKQAFYSGAVKMTSDKFRELNADPEKGLEKFLSGRFDDLSLTSTTNITP